MKKFSLFLISLCIMCGADAASPSLKSLVRKSDPVFLATSEASRIGDQILAYQRVTGGWPKNIDMVRPHTEAELDSVRAQHNRTDDSTTDNTATNTQMRYLAALYQATGEPRFRDGFLAGLEYLFSGQYPEGGWPQFWPNPRGYQVHITYNDNAMVNTMTLLEDIFRQKAPFGGNLVDDAVRERARKAFDKGIECILATQIMVDGKPTVWCQQHNHVTYAPAKARAYELPSYCSLESAGLVRLLMTVPSPDSRIKAAVHGAMKWFDDNKVLGYRYEHVGTPKTPTSDSHLVPDSAAGPVWGRYYDLADCRIYVCDRDGVPRRTLPEIGQERRGGYGWYNSEPAELYRKYEKWAKKYDPEGKVALDITAPGSRQSYYDSIYK